jgi:hypothetical protein
MKLKMFYIDRLCTFMLHKTKSKNFVQKNFVLKDEPHCFNYYYLLNATNTLFNYQAITRDPVFHND